MQFFRFKLHIELIQYIWRHLYRLFTYIIVGNVIVMTIHCLNILTRNVDSLTPSGEEINVAPRNNG